MNDVLEGSRTLHKKKRRFPKKEIPDEDDDIRSELNSLTISKSNALEETYKSVMLTRIILNTKYNSRFATLDPSLQRRVFSRN